MSQIESMVVDEVEGYTVIIRNAQRDDDGVVPDMDYVVGSNHTYQSRHWLDQGTSITVVGTHYLILNDGRQSAVVRLHQALREGIVEVLNTGLKAGYGYKEGRTLAGGGLDIWCTTRDEPHMKWLELSVGGVKVHLEERDIPLLASALRGQPCGT